MGLGSRGGGPNDESRDVREIEDESTCVRFITKIIDGRKNPYVVVKKASAIWRWSINSVKDYTDSSG